MENLPVKQLRALASVILILGMLERAAIDFNGLFGYQSTIRWEIWTWLYIALYLFCPYLIFRRGRDEEEIEVRRFGFFWFFLFYGCHIGVSAYLDLWLMLGQREDVTGAILFLAEAIFVAMLFLSLWRSRQRALDA